MKLFHTSPNEITKIDSSGLFGEFLCFASDPYVMSACETIMYSIELSEDEVVEANSFFYREDCDKLKDIVAEVMDLADCDEDTAEELLSGRIGMFDVVDPASEDTDEAAWELQRLIAKACQALGYRAVETRDEQGAMWLVAMKGREAELIKE